MATESIRIVVSESGTRSVSRNVEQIGGAAGKSAIAVNRLRHALNGLALASGTLQLGKLLDSFTNMQNRLRNVTTSTAQLNVVTSELFEIANRTRTSYESTAEVYSRTALAVKDLGLSQRDTLSFTERLNKTIILSGASAAEAQGAMIQLSQGLASGTLRGDELRSVLEQLPAVADVIAKGLGVTRGELRKLGAEGKISALDIINAYKKFGEEIDGQFAKTIPTMGQALTVMQNKFLEVVSAIDQSLGITETIARAFLNLSEHMDTLVRVGGILAVAILTNLIPAIVSLAASLLVPIFTGNPFLALIGGVVVAVSALVAFGDKISYVGDGLVNMRDFASAVWDNLVEGANKVFAVISDTFENAVKRLRDFFGIQDKAFGTIGKTIAETVVSLYAAFLAVYDTILDRWKLFPQAFVETIWEGIKMAYEKIMEFLSKALTAVGNFFRKLATLDFKGMFGEAWDTKFGEAGGKIADTFNDNFNKRRAEGIAALDKIEVEAHVKAMNRIDAERSAEIERLKAVEELKVAGINKTKGAAGEDGSKRKSFADYLQELQRERDLGLATGDAYKVLNEQIQIANKLRRDLTDTEKAQVEHEVLANLQLERKRALLEEITGPTKEYGANVQALNELYNQGAISLDEFNSKFMQLRENFLNGLPEATTFADGFTQQIEKMQLATRNGFGQMGVEVAKIFGPGGTLVDGIGDAIAQSIVFGKSFKEQIRGIAQQILSQLISSLVKVGLNMVLNATLGQGLMAATAATSAATAGATAMAWAPAAGLSSLATGGANAAGATTAISTIMSMVTAVAGSMLGGGRGFKEGGYTGPVGVNQVAGLVHGQEFVMNAQTTRKHRSTLEALNAGKNPFAAAVAAPASAPVSVAITNEIPDAAYEVKQLSETEVEIIAKRIVRQEAPGVIASGIRNPNSQVSKSLTNNTRAGRRR